MKNNIVLLDTDKFGPASTQLQSFGKAISDSWFKDYKEDIYSEFKLHANKKYRLVGCEELDELDECGLCAHEIIYGCELEAIGEPLVTNHPDLDTSITWPEHMVLGTTCVKMLGFESYVMRFVRSCFKSSYHPSFKVNRSGYVLLGDILTHTDKWNSKYEHLVLPHSVFNVVPKDIMEKASIKLHVLENPFDPKRKLEKTIYRSFHSKNGRWKSAYTTRPDNAMYEEGAKNYDLATVLTREDAKRICEVYSNTRRAR